MAAGITQPGGAGTGIIMEDSSHADAGGDGYYDPIDIATKFPADFVDAGEIILGRIINPGTHAFSFLGETTIPFGPIQDLTIIQRGISAANAVFNVSSPCQNLKFVAIAGANYGARLAGSTNVKGMKFLGAAPALFDLFSSSGDGELPDVEWSQLAPPIGFQSNGTNFYDEILFDLDVLDPRTAGAKLAGIPAELVDAFGATVVDTTTDSEGRIAFGSGQQVNRVKACLRTAIAGVPTRIDQFPLTFKMIHKTH